MRFPLYLFLFSAFWGAQSLCAQSEWPNLRITPEHPQPGETVQIEYDWLKGPLKNAEAIDVLVLVYADKNAEAIEINLKHQGNKLTGVCSPGKNAQSMLIGFQSGEQWDNNNGRGYFVDFYDHHNKKMPESIAAKANLYTGFGTYMELNIQATQANLWMDEAFEAQPALRNPNLSAYIRNWMNAKRGDAGKEKALQLLNELENAPQITEKDWMSAVRSYEFLQAMDQAKALKEKIRNTYPNGVFVQQERRQAINAEPDTTRREKLLETFVKDFPPKTEQETNEINRLYAGLAMRYAEAKNWDRFNQIADKMKGANRADLFNNLAWQLAESGEDLGWAIILGEKASNWAKMEIVAPSTAKPAPITHKNWELERRQIYASYTDTYAFTLDKVNESAKAAELQAVVVEIMTRENDEMNERYTTYLEHANAVQLRHELEGFILDGHATNPMLEQFKRLYLQEDRSENGFKAYYNRMTAVADARLKQKLTQKMTESPAPGFELRNLKGELVSLQQFKGKVVVLDFWATWCGPCKASFPAMQKVQDLYAKDPNVVFLFIDTWERNAPELKASAANDFIVSKNYTFEVLVDLNDGVVANYGITGIPTKFVLDGNGKIRFKSVGWSGSADELIKSLSLMIELAKKAQ